MAVASVRLSRRLLASTCLLFAVSAPAQEFSTQGISHDSAGHTVTSKVYAAGGRYELNPRKLDALCSAERLRVHLEYGLLRNRTRPRQRRCAMPNSRRLPAIRPISANKMQLRG